MQSLRIIEVKKNFTKSIKVTLAQEDGTHKEAHKIVRDPHSDMDITEYIIYIYEWRSKINPQHNVNKRAKK